MNKKALSVAVEGHTVFWTKVPLPFVVTEVESQTATGHSQLTPYFNILLPIFTAGSAVLTFILAELVQCNVT